MIVQEEFISINAEPAVVERYLTDPALLNQWRSPLVVLEPVEGTLFTPGSVHRMRLKSLFLTGALYKVVERDSQHILMQIEGPWEGTERWRWFSDGKRTVVQNRVEYDMTDAILRPFVAGLGTYFSRLDMRLQMQRLQQMVERSLKVPQVTVAQ